MENGPSLVEQAQKRVGTTVGGKYRLEALIGVGGMAAVYAARHRTGHVVAIKCLHERFSRDGDALRWFKREAYVSNQVGHESALAVLDDETDGEGAVFLVMPLLEGESVGGRWKRLGKKLPLSEVVSIVARALDVLATAHAKGIVHRDIKPDNLFLTTSGLLYVLDFGIARVRDHAEAITATRTGIVVGTPTFMAPEQARGRAWEVGPASDVWAVGATVFTLLSGGYVHEGETASEVSAFAATRPARKISEVATDVPEAFAEVVDRALMYGQKERWATAAEFREAWMAAATASGFSSTALPKGVAEVRAIAPLPSESGAGATTNAPPPSMTKTVEEPYDSHGAVPPSARSASAPSRQPPLRAPLGTRGWRSAGFVLATALAGVSAFAWRLSHSIITPAPPVAPATTAAASDIAGKSSQAQALLRAGKQLLHDASFRAAERTLGRALELDPSLASAHLALAAVPATDHDSATLRPHFTRALELRVLLTDAEQRELDAIAPVYAAPPNMALAADRARANFVAHPDDEDAAHLFIQLVTATRDWRRVIDEGEQMLKRFPKSPRIHRHVGRSYMFLHRPDEARREFTACAALVPSAIDCIADVVRLDADTGRCAESEAGARTLLNLDPTFLGWNEFLAQAEFATTGSLEITRAALHAISGLPPEAGVMELSHEYEYALDILSGDFDRGLSELDAAEAEQLAEGAVEQALIDYERVRFGTRLELGDAEGAATAARQFLARRTAWITDSVPDYEIEGFLTLYRAGAIPRSELNAKRDAWSARTHVTAHELWEGAFLGAPPLTREDAEDVLNHAPKDSPSVAPLVIREEAYGEALRLAGRDSEAEEWLSQVAHDCRAIFSPIEQTQANLHLGQLLDARGERKRACDAYGVVVTRWGEKRSRSAREARGAMQRLDCSKRP